jgi:EAL domain-containing protein (putative c-di-GMP-specific phosphodiesterase class I)
MPHRRFCTHMTNATACSCATDLAAGHFEAFIIAAFEARPLTFAAPRPRPAHHSESTGPEATGHGEAVDRVLDFARRQLKMDAAWMSEFVGGQQIFQRVSSSGGGQRPATGSSALLSDSFCSRVLDGTLSALVPNARREPVTCDLPITQALNIGAYVGVPIFRSGGDVYGMLCCIGHEQRVDLSERDVSVMELLAQMLGDLVDRTSAFGASRHDTRRRIKEAIAGNGRHVALQPVVDIHTGTAIAVEALSRFDAAPSPDVWFAEAAALHLGVELELACAKTALATFSRQDLPPWLGVNLSPAALMSSGCSTLLQSVDRRRLIIEITEHAPVTDYDALNEALAPHRQAGAQLAIDDAGAGYASFRHILRLSPDFIKVDIGLIHNVDTDPVTQALITALASVAVTAGARLIAEGVETGGQLATLHRLGVTLSQGYLLGRPSTHPQIDGYPVFPK